MAGRALQRRRRNPGAADWIRRHRVWLLTAGAVGAAGFLWPWLDPQAPDWLPFNRLTGGAKVDDSDAPSGGVCPTPPDLLAASAGVPLDVYSLGRAIRSEAGSSSATERAAVGWCIVNEAKRKGVGVSSLVTKGTNGGGYFGSQNLGGRFVSTRYAPRTKDLELARSILTGETQDPTGGAVRFFNPSLQDRLVKMGTSKYTKTAEDVLASWRADGFEAAFVPGVDPSSFVVFRYVGKGAVNV